MIRVLRLMEYSFDSIEQAQKHLAMCFVPHDGMPKEIGHKDGRMSIRSTILITPFTKPIEDDE